MKKNLPNLYKGKVRSNSNRNQKQAVLNKIETNIKNVVVNDDIENRNINRKIIDIFNSPNYVYRANVSIVMNNGETLKKTIIGRTNNSLITIDDELIDVSKITQIDFLN